MVYPLFMFDLREYCVLLWMVSLPLSSNHIFSLSSILLLLLFFFSFILDSPTIPHCSMATLIGLSLRVKLGRSLPPRFLISVRIEPGTHASEHAINKQLADKERVTAALENAHLLGVVNKCIINGMTGEMEV